MLETLKEKWNEILKYLKEEYDISDVSFTPGFFRWSLCSGAAGNIVKIIVPDANFLGYIKKKYSTMLMVSIAEVTGIKCDSVRSLWRKTLFRNLLPQTSSSRTTRIRSVRLPCECQLKPEVHLRYLCSPVP